MAEMLLGVADPEELSLVARAIPFPAGILHRWLPPVTRRDHRYRFFKRNRRLQRSIPVRAWDTPAVPMNRGDLEEVMGRMFPLSGILWLLEEESQLLDVALQSDDADAIGDIFGQDVVQLTRQALQRVMLMQGEAVSFGTVTVGTAVAPENGLQLGSVDFGVAELGNVFTAPTLFDDTTPGVLGQLGAFKSQYRTNTGGQVDPGVAVCSTRILNTLLVDPEFRALAGSILGTPSSVGVNQLNQVLADRQLPRIVVDDTAVPDYLGVMTRQIPDNRIVFLPEDPANGGNRIGQTQWGLTEEAKKLARANELSVENGPGLVAVPMEEENPVQTGTLVTGIAMPVVTEPDLVMSVKVLDDATA